MNARQKSDALRFLGAGGVGLFLLLVARACSGGVTTGMVFPELGVLITLSGLALSALCMVVFGFRFLLAADVRPKNAPARWPVFLVMSYIVCPIGVLLLWITREMVTGSIGPTLVWTGSMLAFLCLGFVMLVLSEVRHEGHPVAFYLSVLANFGYVVAYVVFPK